MKGLYQIGALCACVLSLLPSGLQAELFSTAAVTVWLMILIQVCGQN